MQSVRNPTPREEAILDALVAVARPIIREEFNADSCIASTKAALDALAYFGVHGREMPVVSILFNAEAAQLLEGGMDMTELGQRTSQIPADEPDGPWSVGVGAGPGGVGKWPGHLVSTVPGIGAVIDLSLDQAARPHKNLNPTPFWAHVDNPAWWGPKPATPIHTLGTSDGTVVVLDRRARDPRGYKSSPNWDLRGPGREAVHRKVVAGIITAMREVVDC